MRALPRRNLRCILFPDDQPEGSTFALILILLLSVSGLVGHASIVAESVATLAMAAAAVAESVALVTIAAAEMVRFVAAVRASVRLR